VVVIFISNGKYLKPYGYIIFGLFVALFLYIASGKSILNEYGGALPKIGLAFVGIKLFIWTSTFYQNKEIKLDTGFSPS
jgi:hypothetical protein